jgi:hypothetical protein
VPHARSRIDRGLAENRVRPGTVSRGGGPLSGTGAVALVRRSSSLAPYSVQPVKKALQNKAFLFCRIGDVCARCGNEPATSRWPCLLIAPPASERAAARRACRSPGWRPSGGARRSFARVGRRRLDVRFHLDALDLVDHGAQQSAADLRAVSRPLRGRRSGRWRRRRRVLIRRVALGDADSHDTQLDHPAAARARPRPAKRPDRRGPIQLARRVCRIAARCRRTSARSSGC